MKLTTKHTLSILSTAVVALLTSVSQSHGAAITWVGGSQQISGDSDVSTAGQLVGAFNVGATGDFGFGPLPGSSTVNGVNFQPFTVFGGSASASVGNFSLTSNGGPFLSGDYFGSPSAPFSALNTGYQTILRSAAITAQPATFDLTMSGLTLGVQYQFQWWANFSGPGVGVHAATSVNGISLLDNTSGVEGGLGQFAIGTFTADSATQVLRFAPIPPNGPGSSAQLNAFQLRAVPETASFIVCLLPVGVLLLGGLVRRRVTPDVQF